MTQPDETTRPDSTTKRHGDVLDEALPGNADQSADDSEDGDTGQG